MANNNFKMKHFQLALSSQNLYQVQLKKPFFLLISILRIFLSPLSENNVTTGISR